MKKLQDILSGIRVLQTKGRLNISVSGLCIDSRKASPGSLFAAIKGTQVDGHQFIETAIQNGAITVICSKLPVSTLLDVTYIQVENSSEAIGQIASNFFDQPSNNLKLVGITGTNGKTTTVTLLYNLFTGLGYKTGLISTIQNKIAGKISPATHTTPDAVSLNQLLKDMVDAGCEYVFMEVSSHAIDQDRIAGLKFGGAVFTNLTHDHLDYHKTFKEYLNAKKKLFDELPKTAFTLSNIDDKNGRVMLQNTKATKKSYSLKTLADFKGKIIESSFEGLQLQINGQEIYSLLSGEFNAYNLLAAYGTAISLGQDNESVLTKLSKIHAAEGRFQMLRSSTGITCFIDYAHTPDALENVLKTINSIRTHNEKLITLIGAGGDRDMEKRPKMARIASLLSDTVILTSDNPRSEDPEMIIKDMQTGIDPAKTNKTLAITNREAAIKTAVNLASPGDIILVAGKGHEKYQEIKGVKYPFDDMAIVNKLFETV
ncbi:MAG: UDP-N-acetylmuramoyl-L-alanyl-D-glutamate--2,6-diaminopimelate ligase [Marinilabiliales bacterium]|nr:MAG: UDP-N-acetylmuramoyl-L-alanyl-D-glutamate--2,6-diaminopimelate ligase [Marinilabiliales bacterium]